jgi:putative toxin-antitoxin system antitoxin component (TIGR02293 family)
VIPIGAIVKALGGRKTLRRRISNTEDLKQLIRKGLPFEAFETILETFSLTREEVSSALKLPLRTLARRRIERRLLPDESDRLLRLSWAAVEAARILGSAERAGRWLKEENRALAGQAPLLLLDTEIGAREVGETLGRIEHGIYS